MELDVESIPIAPAKMLIALPPHLQRERLQGALSSILEIRDKDARLLHLVFCSRRCCRVAASFPDESHPMYSVDPQMPFTVPPLAVTLFNGGCAAISSSLISRPRPGASPRLT